MEGMQYLNTPLHKPVDVDNATKNGEKIIDYLHCYAPIVTRGSGSQLRITCIKNYYYLQPIKGGVLSKISYAEIFMQYIIILVPPPTPLRA